MARPIVGINRRLINKWAGLALRAIDADWKKCPRQHVGLECPGLRCHKGPHRAVMYIFMIQRAMRQSLIMSNKSLK